MTGTPGRTLTCDPPFRKRVLYTTELREQMAPEAGYDPATTALTVQRSTN